MAETPTEPGSQEPGPSEPKAEQTARVVPPGETAIGKSDDTNRAQPGTNGTKDPIREMLDRLSRAVPTLAETIPILHDAPKPSSARARSLAGLSSRPSDMTSPI